MKHHAVKLCFALCLWSFFSVIFPVKIFAFSGSGTGTSGDPFLITTCSQLQEIDTDIDAYYQLTQHIDCTGTSFSPISNFSGTLDGQDYTISHLSITITMGYAGLFSSTNTGAVIKNVHLRDGTVTAGSSSYSASFAGRTDGNTTIIDSSSNLTNIGESASGIVSLVNGGTLTITRTSFTGNLTTDWVYGGGLVGIATSGGSVAITDSYTSGNYTSVDYSGGLVGYLESGSITNSYSSAHITANGGTTIGGLVGHVNDGLSISNSFFAGSVSGTSTVKGAVFGQANDTFTSVYFDAAISGVTSCVGAGSGACNSVNVGNTTPNYFKNNSTNPPLDTWNFSGVWKRTSSYPIFGINTDQDSPPSTSTQSSAGSHNDARPPVCSDHKPENTPDLFQINTKLNEVTLYFAPAKNSTKYFIAYGYSANDVRFGVEFPVTANDGVQSYTISMLSPQTTYYFKVRSGNGCMPGDWSNVLEAKTTKGKVTNLFYRYVDTR